MTLSKLISRLPLDGKSRFGFNLTHRVLTALLVLGRFHPYLCCERKSNEREKMKKLRGIV